MPSVLSIELQARLLRPVLVVKASKAAHVVKYVRLLVTATHETYRYAFPVVMIAQTALRYEFVSARDTRKWLYRLGDVKRLWHRFRRHQLRQNALLVKQPKFLRQNRRAFGARLDLLNSFAAGDSAACV